MCRWGPYDDWSIRVGDAKEVLEWKIRYYLREIEQSKAYDHDNYCLGDVEDIIEASDQITARVVKMAYPGYVKNSVYSGSGFSQ